LAAVNYSTASRLNHDYSNRETMTWAKAGIIFFFVVMTAIWLGWVPFG
jgi:hypothetical protein